MKRFAKRLLRCGACAILVATAAVSLPAHAAKVMQMEADDMVRAAGHVRDTLGLSPNQQTLWRQVASKSGALLWLRQARRGKLQAGLKIKLADPRQEMRDLAAEIEAESTASFSENRELRELWLTLNDALNDQQHVMVAQFMAAQLERGDAPERGAGRGEPPQGVQRRQKPEGGAGGPPRF